MALRRADVRLFCPTGQSNSIDSVVIVFALVPYGENRDGLVIVDLEQRHVSGSTERNDQFAQERVARRGLAAAERRKLQTAERGLDLKIAPFLQSEENAVVMHSLELLEVIAESKQIVPLLFGLISSDNPKIQSKAALIIQKLDSEQAYTRRLLQHPDARVRANALQGIVDRANDQGGEFLLQGLADTDHRVRTLAAVGLSRLGDPQGLQTLFRMLRHPKPIERRSAAWGLGVCGNASALPRLEVLARGDPDERVRELAAQACQKITERAKAEEKQE